MVQDYILSKSQKIILLLFIVLLISGGYFWRYYDTDSELDINLSYVLLFFALLLIIIGNYLISNSLNKILPWKKRAGLRFVLEMLLTTAFSLACVNAIYIWIKNHFTGVPAETSQIVLLNMYIAAMIIPIHSIIFGVRFLKFWRKAEIETERLKNENIKSQISTLKNHLDPHFLFNNLNAVSSLIDRDPELSKKYLDKFAEVYRIILKSEYSDLISLQEEMDLVATYIYLINIRFEHRVFFKIFLDDSKSNLAIVPLSIQMLIENALKHNRLSIDDPLEISIRLSHDQYLVVENNKQLKPYSAAEKSGTGLENIRKRYQFFTDKTIEILETNKIFRVRLPLLEIE